MGVLACNSDNTTPFLSRWIDSGVCFEATKVGAMDAA